MLRRMLLPMGGGSFTLEDLMGLPIYNVESYGAVHDGSTDDAAAIQAAINALPACGGIVYFPCGEYAIGSTIDVGDGTTSTGSTRNGVHLMGAGISSPYSSFGWTGLSAVNGAKLLWIGGADPMVRINGPIAGWGMTDIALDGAGVASDGLQVVSGVHGYVARVGVLSCQYSFHLTTIVPTGGLVGQAVGTFHNRFEQIVAQMPGSFANQYGLFLNAGSSAQGVFMNVFDEFFISYTNQTTNVAEGIRLDGCDGNVFREGHMAGIPSGSNNYLVSFIYGTKADWPADNTLQGFSFGTTASGKFYNANTPTGSHPNRVIDIRYGDGRPSDPGLANLDWGFVDSDP